jgi:hypothetical protein
LRIRKIGTRLTTTHVLWRLGNSLSRLDDRYARAVAAKELIITIGRPSLKTFMDIVTNNLLPNCPVTRADIAAAEEIFGPDIGSLKGKTIRQSPQKIKPTGTQIDEGMLQRYKRVEPSVNVMYINKIPFLVTLSRHIHFGTVEALTNRQPATMLAGIKHAKQLYKQGGLQVVMTYMDGEFEPMRGELAALGIGLNEAARDEHVGDFERYIRTVKERVRSTSNTLPYRHVPPRLVIEMAKAAIFWLNAFPYVRGVSKPTQYCHWTNTGFQSTLSVSVWGVMSRLMKNMTTPWRPAPLGHWH